MSSFRFSDVTAFLSHSHIVRRVATDLPELATEAATTHEAEGVGVWSFLAAVALLTVALTGAAGIVAPLPWGVAALSIKWDRNEEILFAVGSDPAEVKISALAEVDRPGSSLLSQKIAAQAGSLEGEPVAAWFGEIGAPDAAATVRAGVARTKRQRLLGALLAGVTLLLTPLVTAQVGLRVTDPPADLGAADLAAPLALWAGFWGALALPFSLATLVLPASPTIAALGTAATLLVIGGGAWQLYRILATLAGADLKQGLTVYVASWLLLWGVGVGLSLATGLAG